MTMAPGTSAVHLDDAQMWVELDDGLALGVPLT